MKCAMCNGEIIKEVGVIEFDSKALGVVCVPNIKHQKCKSCGDVLIPSGESEKLLKFVTDKENRAIGRLPFDAFVSLNEAAKILGISKQAFSKKPKIKNGLIYSAVIGTRRYYVRKSVERFKESGNGKYLLAQNKTFDGTIVKPLQKNMLEKWIIHQPTKGRPRAASIIAGVIKKPAKRSRPNFPTFAATKEAERNYHNG